MPHWNAPSGGASNRDCQADIEGLPRLNVNRHQRQNEGDYHGLSTAPL